MAYEFNGTSQSLSTASTPVTVVPLTIACWFYPDTITTNYTLLQISNGTALERFGIAALGAVAGDPVRAFSLQNGVGAVADSTVGFSASSWQHACGVFSTTNSRSVFLNGTNSSTNTGASTPVGVNKIEIAFRTDVTPGLFLDGRLAEVGIWNAALTAQEVASLAKGMTCDKVRPQSLVFYAPLVRDLIDQKGGLTITNNNGATVNQHPRVYA
jgi:hypothetical protein